MEKNSPTERGFQIGLFLIVEEYLFVFDVFSGLETLKVFHAEVLDVGSLTANIFFCHADIDVGRLLKEFGCTVGIIEDEQTHYQLGSHVIETTGEEVLGILILKGLHVG